MRQAAAGGDRKSEIASGTNSISDQGTWRDKAGERFNVNGPWEYGDGLTAPQPDSTQYPLPVFRALNCCHVPCDSKTLARFDALELLGDFH